MSKWFSHLLLPHDLGSPGRARSFVRHLLDEHELPELADDVQLVVTELATNAVVHARTPFSVSVSRDGPVLRVRVEDGAPEHPALSGDAGPDDTGGRGLTLVEGVSDSWGVERIDGHAKAVWATFAVEQA
ncbi:ATP-binding protein [Aeromicrobium massiliense]|uniref:ATP-binding protein n=1 Tax=Aeromicrobium massiliense TaxID=1464554 RepID=UPI00031F2C9A|nr:ATP-binding protein [Aeromicrobium massiliense]